MPLPRLLPVLALAAACGLAQAAAPGVPAGPLPRTVMPTEVRLELKVDPKQPTFSGTTSISVRVAEPTSTIWMHGQGLTIRSARYMPRDGRNQLLTASVADVSGVLRLDAPKTIMPGEGVVHIEYEAPFGELQGAYRVSPDGRQYVLTQMEPIGARTAFPGFDEPAFKQPWQITLVVPENDVAVANTAQASVETLAGGWKKVVFDRTEALPSYLIAFAVGPWDVVDGPDIAPNSTRATPLKLRGIAAHGQGGRMRYTLANTPAIVTALEEYFGIAYPFGKLDNLAAPDFWAGAMENPGLIVYRDSLMFPDEQSATGRRQSFWGVSAHELAHQWFGDLVTMEWWDDLWLNEGFATWMGNKIHGRLQPQAHTDRGLLEGAIRAMSADSLASTRRIHEPVRDFRDIESAFDGITYQKGGATLAMFERYIGEENFRQGIRAYLTAHARGNATSADLIAAVAARSDDPARVSKAFFSFIDQPGVPLVTVDLDCSTKTPALLLSQRRYLPIGSDAAADQTWGIPMTVRYADGATIREQRTLLDTPQARIELTQAASCPAWVMPNGYGAGYYRFALVPKLQQALSRAFQRLDEREQRMVADSAVAAYDAGELAPAQLLALLPRFGAAPVRQTATAGLGQVAWMAEYLLGDAAARRAFHAKLASIYRPRLDALGLSPRTGEPEEDALLRASLVDAFALDFEDPQVRSAMDATGRAVLGLGGDGALHADAAPRDLRGTALKVAVKEGGTAAFDAAERALRGSQDAVLRGELLEALGSASDPALAGRARALVFEDGLLRRNEIRPIVATQAGLPEARKALREWIGTHFDQLTARLAPAGSELIGYAAAGMCSPQEAADLQRRFGDRVATLEGGPRELQQTVEGIGLCAAKKAAREGQPLTVPTK